MNFCRATIACLKHDDYCIYVGTYPNDPATIAAVLAVDDPRIRLVRGIMPGPTTKAECLNRCWAALCTDEAAEGVQAKAIVLHDAEDVVHRDELILFDTMIERFDVVQIPVLPLVDTASRWVGGTYVDEFAEAHGRQLIVREAIGAAMPLAGTGCALARHAIQALADSRRGGPFDDESLTEDYEMGLRLAAAGMRGAFVPMRTGIGGSMVAVRAYFPAEFDAAVRQKARWMTGIALAGWDRLRWGGGLAERWMRLRDRRAVLAAIILAAAYLAIPLTIACRLLGLAPNWPQGSGIMLRMNLALLGWRMAMRMLSVTQLHGWREGLRALPRMLSGNVIAICAAWRAVVRYRPGHRPVWDKTVHYFPDISTG